MTRIALVDDEINILTSVSMALETEGFEVDTYKNGEEYFGSWHYGERRGEGSMIFSNGIEFKGHWHDDYPSDGEMIFPDGTTFNGWFNQLSFDFSSGVITYPDGSKFKGWFDDNEKLKDKLIYYLS